jgi:hypothetical protein
MKTTSFIVYADDPSLCSCSPSLAENSPNDVILGIRVQGHKVCETMAISMTLYGYHHPRRGNDSRNKRLTYWIYEAV